ncbi:hypothetical protein [Streptomyces lasiicapitis]|uniref:hypothetical protein n=1 Tax=Streptomyces lasiicapitis TaxID=1923961 RepID=UPI00365AE5DA
MRLEARLRHLGENDPATPAVAVERPARPGERPDTARRDERELLVQGVRTPVRGLEAERRDEPGLALEHFTEAGYLLERAGWRNPAFAPWEYWAARVCTDAGATSSGPRS